MILTVRELVNHLGMNPKTEFVGASILVRTLERLGAIKKVGTRPFLDENGKPTIGRPSALYEFPETVTFDFPSEALEFVPKVKKAKKAKKAKVSVPEVDVVDADLSEVVETETVVDDEPVVAESVETEPESVEREVVAETVETEPETVERDEVVAEDEDEEVDFSSDSLLEQFLRESA